MVKEPGQSFFDSKQIADACEIAFHLIEANYEVSLSEQEKATLGERAVPFLGLPDTDDNLTELSDVLNPTDARWRQT